MKTVLFVCVHNAGRSQMAEALLNAMAAERGAEVRAESAGTVGGKEINPMAAAAMEEIGISMQDQRPKLLSLEMAGIGPYRGSFAARLPVQELEKPE